ncbi:hypothetical protein [Paenibacillus naphthalenovorans]|uniref:hypothetical protein n=1 Tax=Paenibacillus naphthalenovorans TaxID=162209 RepID=UPI003D2D7551
MKALGDIVKLLFASGEFLYMKLSDMKLSGMTIFADGSIGYTGQFRHGGQLHQGAVELRRIRWNGRFFEANMSD